MDWKLSQVLKLSEFNEFRPPKPLNGNLTAYPNTMSLTLQTAVCRFKTCFLDIKIQASEGFRPQTKRRFGAVFTVPKPNWYMDSRDDFAVKLYEAYCI